MGFLAPISFLFLSAIPVLLVFYFFKKQYEKRTISSIYLWERTMQEWETDRWWKRLQKNLLLLLQLLFLLLVIFALTRPFLVGKEVGGDHLVIILDSSATMSANVEGDTRFERAQQQAKALLNEIGRDHKVSIIDAQQAPVLLASNETNHTYVATLIENLQVTYEHENLLDSIQLGQSLIQQETGEIHIFTDNMSAEQLEEVTLTDAVVVHNIEATLDNTSLLAFGVKQTDNTVSAIINVKNESEQEQTISVAIKHDGAVIDTVSENIAANTALTMMVNDLSVHDYYEAEIERDDYLADNNMFALLPSQTSPSIYVAGETSPFVERALLSAGFAYTTVARSTDGIYHFPEESEAVFLLSGVGAEQWPAGPKLVISPLEGGPFEIEEKVELSYVLRKITDDPVLQYTDVDHFFLGKAYEVGNWNGFQALVQSGEQIVMAKGQYDNTSMLLLPFDITDSDWPLHPGFPILLANSIDYLAEGSQPIGYVGPTEEVKVQLATATEEAVLETLDGENVSDVNLSTGTVVAPREPGIYQLHEKSVSGSDYRHLVVQLDSNEKTAQSAASFSINVEGQPESDTTVAKLEFWSILAALALLILFIEWEVYRRGVASR